LAVLWQTIASGVLIAWFAPNYRTGMLRVRGRIWKIRVVHRVDKTVPAALSDSDGAAPIYLQNQSLLL
jgi:hypothetical protein